MEIFEDRVPQRVFGAVLPVAPLVRDLRINLEGRTTPSE